MKRTVTEICIVLIAATMFGNKAMAQYSADYYHRVGDTITERPNNGFFVWWNFDDIRREGRSIEEPVMGLGAFKYGGYAYSGQYLKFTTPVPLRVVGIAGVTYQDIPNTISDNNFEGYFRMYDATPTGKVPLCDTLKWDPATTPCRYVEIVMPRGESLADSCCGQPPVIKTQRLFERYFDSAIIVTDSFYVGGGVFVKTDTVRHDNKNYFCIQGRGMLYPCAGEEDFDPSTDPYTELPPASVIKDCLFPPFTYWFTDVSPYFQNNSAIVPDRHITVRELTLVYPIIWVDTTLPPTTMCGPVENVEVSTDTGGRAQITWDAFLHYSSCEVQYGPVNQLVSSYPIANVQTNALLLQGLDTTVAYQARVRAYCDTSKLTTEWSDWVRFTLPQREPPHDPQGVQGATVLSQFTTVVPNPASDNALVLSGYSLQKVEVYSTNGVLVYSERADGQQHSIDLKGWARGNYIVLVETVMGRTAKRLTVVK